MRSLKLDFLMSLQATAVACCLAIGVAAAAPNASATKPAAPAAKPATPAAKPVTPPKMAPMLTGVASPAEAALLPNYSKDDPAKVAAARAFLLAYRPNLDPVRGWAMLDKMMPRMIARQLQDNPKLDVAKYDRETRTHMMSRLLGSLDLQAHVVSRHFTLQELKDLQAFFVAPLGKKLITETPFIKRDMYGVRRPGAPMGTAAGGVKVITTPNKTPPAPKKK
jgi:hypothetical protein